MLNSFKYYKTESCIHLINPVCKILISIIFIIMLLITFSMKSIIAMSLILSFIIGLSNVPYSYLIKPIWDIKILLLLIFIISLPFSFHNSIILISKIIIITIYYSILIMSTKIIDLTKGFYTIYKPLKIFGVEIDKLSIISALFVNFIPFYLQEKNSLKTTVQNQNIKNKLYNNIRIINITYNNILKKRDIMLIRGILSYENNYKWQLSDIYIIMCHIVVLTLVLIKEVVV